MENNKLTGVVFLDLKKAFDTVNHEILLSKLEQICVHENSINWFKNYLSGRYQCVKVQGNKSDKKLVTCGVPQGSILGPLLFIIYINDLDQYLQDCHVNLYADDTALYTEAKSYVELMLNLRMEMAIVTEWLKANKLTLNLKKTKYVIFGPKAKLQNLNAPLYLDREKIEKTRTMKYLGVILDDELSFNDHINYIHTKATNKLGILRKSRDFLDKKTSLLLYQSLVLPHFDYCDTTYGCTSTVNLNKLQLVQNSACRTVLRCGKREPIANMHKDLNILTLEIRRKLHLSMDCHKAIHTNNSMTRYFQTRATRTTRAGDKRLVIPNLKTNMGRKAFSYRGPSHWEGLPVHLKNIKSPDVFKSECLKTICRDENHPT